MSYRLAKVGVVRIADGVEILPGTPPWREYQEWLAKDGIPEPEPIAVRALPARRQEISARVNGERSSVMERASVDVDGFRWDADTFSTTNLLAIGLKVVSGWTMPLDFTWRTADNELAPMNPGRLNRVLSAVVARREAIFRRSWQLKDTEIAASDDPDAIDLKAGWPE